jgi:virginiamycin A acetyltransferase
MRPHAGLRSIRQPASGRAPDLAKDIRQANYRPALNHPMPMNLVTSDDCTGVITNHPWSKHFVMIGYKDGAFSCIPNRFFRDWLDEEAQFGDFHIGRCSGLGVGSIVKYDGAAQKLVIGKNVAGGLRLRFLLNGQHETRTMSTTMFSGYGTGIISPPMPQYADTVIHNDVWIGDEALFLGGSVVASGCVIGARAVVPPNFRSEPYGVYAGSPARLLRFRFPEKVREKLLELAWWDMPLDWIKANNDAFLVDLTVDEGRALETLSEVQRAKDAALGKKLVAPAPVTAQQ